LTKKSGLKRRRVRPIGRLLPERFIAPFCVAFQTAPAAAQRVAALTDTRQIPAKSGLSSSVILILVFGYAGRENRLPVAAVAAR
jgi:hypothetical protein